MSTLSQRKATKLRAVQNAANATGIRTPGAEAAHRHQNTKLASKNPRLALNHRVSSHHDHAACKHAEKLKGKVGGAFASSSGIASGAETTLLSIVKALFIHGMIIQGRHDGKHYGPAAIGAPDDKATEDCRELGNRIARLALRLRT